MGETTKRQVEDTGAEPEHTPGPLHYHKCGTFGYPVIHTNNAVAHYAVANCLVHEAIDEQTAEANAAFIVRACNSHADLLGVAESLVRACERYDENGNVEFDENTLLLGQLVRVAIGRIRGELPREDGQYNRAAIAKTKHQEV